MEEKWDSVYMKNFGGMWCPDEGVVKFVARYIQRRVGIELYEKKKGFKKILDLGCGNGRHIVFLSEQGFDVYGIDISAEAIEIASAWTTKIGLKANLRTGDIKELPYENDSFDVIISYGVLDHILFSDAKKAMQEIRRVCLPGGYIFVTLRATEDCEFNRGKRIENNNFILQEGYEKGIMQHYFDQEEIKELFDGLEIFDIELYEQRFPDIYTVNKAFLQSSKGEKKPIDLSKSLDMNLKYARWYITAKKSIDKR